MVAVNLCTRMPDDVTLRYDLRDQTIPRGANANEQAICRCQTDSSHQG
jgi:hypothetical protein